MAVRVQKKPVKKSRNHWAVVDKGSRRIKDRAPTKGEAQRLADMRNATFPKER